ncbi:MAG: methionyl-tRNA formyltransferase [Planctomycetota bacterium]|jgi:methionyl-tRNA formyltransferase
MSRPSNPDGSHASRPARLRVLFVTEDDPLYVMRFFEVFFAEYPPDEIEICAITVDRAFRESLVKTARRVMRLYGPVGFVRLGLRFLVCKLRGANIEALARRSGIRSLPTTSVNDPDYVGEVKTLGPDLIVSVAAPEIFRSDILAAARLGCVNIHSGRLPKYRGMMPNFWQMLHGESRATVTVHEMAEKLDAGDVLATVDVAIRTRDSLDRVMTETKRQGARLMIDVLRQIAAGDARPQPVNMSGAEYFSFPKPPDVKAFRERGHRLL